MLQIDSIPSKRGYDGRYQDPAWDEEQPRWPRNHRGSRRSNYGDRYSYYKDGYKARVLIFRTIKLLIIDQMCSEPFGKRTRIEASHRQRTITSTIKMTRGNRGDRMETRDLISRKLSTREVDRRENGTKM